MTSFVYNLPFGKRGHFGTSWNPVWNALLGNWEVSGIFILQSGLPVVIGTPAVNIGQRAELSDPTIARWFDTSVFRPAAAFTFGSLGPRLPDVRSDGFRNLDFGLFKGIPFTIADRQYNAQFRAEFFNSTNNPQFGAPNGTVTSQSFGIVTSQANDPRSIQFGLRIMF